MTVFVRCNLNIKYVFQKKACSVLSAVKCVVRLLSSSLVKIYFLFFSVTDSQDERTIKPSTTWSFDSAIEHASLNTNKSDPTGYCHPDDTYTNTHAMGSTPSKQPAK